MGKLPSWIVVAAVGAVIVLAAADALRSTGDGATKASVAATEPISTVVKAEPAGLHGVIVVGPDCSSIQAIRLPTLISFQPPRQTDCDGYRWSRDGTLYARCEGRTTEVGTSEGRAEFSIAGCEPAWRPDGALTVIRNGSLIVTRSIGRPSELLTRAQLGEALEGTIPRPRSYTLTQVGWLDSNHVAAIVHGARPGEQALIVLSALIGELQYSDPQVAAGLADLRASPFGDYIAYVRAGFVRQFAMIDLQGREVRLPPIGNALNVAWSPDERYVAISTRTTTFIARTGTERVIFEVPAGGESLAWLP
jgi:hypothetical protein